jgi:carbonic anhydrase
MVNIVQAQSNEHIETIRRLFLEYAGSLGIDLGFQDFDNELAGLPGAYAPPDGRLYLAIEGTRPAGCSGIKKISTELCELKRLYVCPLFRGKGIGRHLVLAAVKDAREIGYKKMRLDSLPSMRRALDLYRSMGFKPIEPFYNNPVAGAVFLELNLE